MSELKPCQCGAPAFAEKKEAYGVGWWRIECTACGIQTREESDYARVVATWNARATDAELERLRDVALALRQHLALLCGPDDAIARAFFERADALIRGTDTAEGEG